MSTLGDNLKKYRLLCDMSQEDVAAEIHKSKGTYSRYETGSLMPDAATLIEIADLYHISLDLLTGRISSREEWLDRFLPFFGAGQALGDAILRQRATKRRKKAEQASKD